MAIVNAYLNYTDGTIGVFAPSATLLEASKLSPGQRSPGLVSGSRDDDVVTPFRQQAQQQVLNENVVFGYRAYRAAARGQRHRSPGRCVWNVRGATTAVSHGSR